jgi:branched-chain amino acid transport system substrate-binding protein
MSAQLLSLKNRGADAFLVFTYAADGALLLHQMKQLSFKQPVVTSSGAFLPAALQLVSSSDLENVWGAVDSVLDDRAVARTFTTDYKAKFGMKADAFAAEYYDAAMLMAEAMRKVGTQPDKIMAYLATAKYSGVGAPIQFDSSRDGIHEVTIANCKQGTKDVVAVTTIRPSR